jgi:hypothetical protein
MRRNTNEGFVEKLGLSQADPEISGNKIQIKTDF